MKFTFLLSLFTTSTAFILPSLPTTTVRGESTKLDVQLPVDPWSDPIPTTSTTDVPLLLPSSNFFSSLKKVSPYAAHALTPISYTPDLDPTLVTEFEPDLQWQTIESHSKNTNKPCYKIEKARFGPGVEVLRFRSKIQGYADSKKFADMIMTTAERSKWDEQLDEVYQSHEIGVERFKSVGEWGECRMLGVGYCKTKKAVGGMISPREQLTICGILEGIGGSVIWGVEAPPQLDHLFPEGERKVRASTDLFGTTLIQQGDHFEVEYVLKLDIGGKVPGWTTGPVVVKTVKELFKFAKDKFGREREVGEEMVRKRVEMVREEFELLIPQ
ncbi:hypothetical protein TrLO_g4560 [Triparma laevis f. longispina]|uniref:START domain-containing protein n=1 Tax=Triparma laevis f. longispina TaxID=1714387 RepID=A0A9W6ZAB7_9STRA|nr:hypothetical protein TrLO_g4560 [Triparma laevis f. longispina]